MEITRELLEQYLRATGWERGERKWWRRGTFEIGTFEGMSSATLAVAVDRLARAERCLTVEIAFRLGLCAAAERLIQRAALERDPRLVTEAGDARVAVLTSEARHFLDAAGIDPQAWERARQKGGG